MATSLTLAEEVILLTIGQSRRRVARSLRVAGLPDRRHVVASLEDKGLLETTGLRRRSRALPRQELQTLRRRLAAIIGHVDAPHGADAELLLLVAFAGGLDGASSAAHLNARHRISDMSGPGKNPPALLHTLCNVTGASSAEALAGKLLPGRVRVRPGELDPGVNSAIWGGGHGGGTLGH